MNSYSKITNIHLTLISLFIVFYVLYIWSSLIIPFLIAMLFSFAIIWLSDFYNKIKIPSFLSMILAIATYLIIFWLIWKMIWSNITELKQNMESYQNELINIIDSVFIAYDIPKTNSINNIIDKINFSWIFSSVAWWVTSILSSAWMIFFYVMFILLEYRYFWDKIKLMVTNKERWKKVWEIIDKINADVKSYFVIKTIVSLVTASLSYIVMIIFWLNFAIFWAFLIFILNYIPSVWSIMALIFPIVFALIQPWFSLYDLVFMSSWLIWIQILMWNIIEPKFMWNKLNLSPLVIIIALWFWWYIWWIVGMFLSVPLMAMINIVLSKFDSTRPIAILLSEKWIIVDNTEEIIKNRMKMINKIKKRILKK